MRCREIGNDQLKVSIITPCYNSEKTIRQTIESVLNQTYKNIEYIIIDGGSTDKTVAIIKEYMPLFRGRLKYVSEKDNGIYDAMNKGIRMSRGKLIGIINSDDYYETIAVEKVVEYYNEKKEQIIYGYMCTLDNRGKIFLNKNSHKNLKNEMIPHSTCFVSRKVYKKYGLFSKKLRIVSDYEFMLRVSKSFTVEFIQIPCILANFRLGGISSTKLTQLEKNTVKLRYGYLPIKDYVIFLIEYLFVK